MDIGFWGIEAMLDELEQETGLPIEKGWGGRVQAFTYMRGVKG